MNDMDCEFMHIKSKKSKEEKAIEKAKRVLLNKESISPDELELIHNLIDFNDRQETIEEIYGITKNLHNVTSEVRRKKLLDIKRLCEEFIC